MKQYYSPLRYPGGKSRIFNFISSLLFTNKCVGYDYAEPYAGGAGLALRLLFEGLVNNIYINDLDKSIYSFWLAATEYADDLCSWVSDVDVSVDSWYFYKSIQKNRDNENLMDLAKSTFFLNRTNISGVIKGGIIGGFEQKGQYKLNARFNKEDLINRIQRLSKFKAQIFVSNLDGIEFIKSMNDKQSKVFLYLDPPYYQKGAELYMNSYTNEDHKKLSKFICGLNKKWILSYDNHIFILNLYAEKRRLSHRLTQSTSNRVGDEVLIFADGLNVNESITHLKSPVMIF